MCRFLTSPAEASVVPTITTSLPVPMGLTYVSNLALDAMLTVAREAKYWLHLALFVPVGFGWQYG